MLGRTAQRLRSARAVLHRAGAGPGAGARAADRRAVGPRLRRLPARPLPGPLAGVERPLPRRRAPVLAARAASTAASSRAGCRPRATASTTASARRCASVNYVAAHDGFTLRRPGQLPPQAQRGQRRSQPRRPRRQLQRQLRRRRAAPTIRTILAAARPPAPRAARHRAAGAGHADAAPPATRLGHTPAAATTTPTARTTRSAGSTGRAPTPSCSPSSRRLHRAAARSCRRCGSRAGYRTTPRGDGRARRRLAATRPASR
ncbi:MAG: hypothetical protein MZW92_04715 [Comamonadaceae bacterium]|nr:hypothetical protein [Comamonadaceae bacterium]